MRKVLKKVALKNVKILKKNGEKSLVNDQNILSDYVILDPEFLETLSKYQKKNIILNTLCQSIESVWSKSATKESKGYALQAIRIILENIDAYLESKIESMALMTQAIDLSNKAIAISKTTAVREMGHKLSDKFGINHGHAIALCIPYVWLHLLESQKDLIIEDALNNLTNIIRAKSNKDAIGTIAGLFIKLDLYHEFNYDDDVISEIVISINAQKLRNHPIDMSDEILADVFRKVLHNEIYQKKNRYLNLWEYAKKEAIKYKNIRKLQLLELDILMEVDRICKENNIKYYLGEGTLLGAVRHNGFIPWDDDIDILMEREDYVRFNTIASKFLPSNLVLQNYKNTKNYFLFTTKVRMTDNREFEQSNISNILENNGPYIDIFPLDYVPRKSSFIQKFIARKVKLFRYIIFYKSKALGKPKKNKKKLIAYYLRFFFSSKFLLNSIDKSIQKYNRKSSKKYIANYASYYNITRETFVKSMYGIPKFIEFEGHELPVPFSYHSILTSIYGNYRKMPPLNNRKIKHNFIKTGGNIIDE